MSLNDEIVQFLAQADSKPAASKLEPYAEGIRAVRQRRWAYREITEALRERFGVSVAASTVHNFQKVRSKRGHFTSPSNAAAETPIALPKEKAEGKRQRFHLDPL